MSSASTVQDADEHAEPRQSPFKRQRVRIALLIIALALLIAGGFWLFKWWTHGRFVQSTNDAFMQVDQFVVTSRTAGIVEQVLVLDNQAVVAGQPLLEIDSSTSRAQLDQAQAQIAQANADMARYRAQVAEQQAAILQSEAQTAGARARWQYNVREVERYEPLSAIGAERSEKLAQLVSDRDQGLATVQQDEASVVQSKRRITTLLTQIEESRARVDEAHARAQQSTLEVERASIRARVSGRVGDLSARVGAYVQSATRLMTIVPIQSLYVVANFKETQIGLMRVGQPAEIKVDALDGHRLTGKVESFAPGTGAQFSILPAANATGNFTKIVQRVPVRLRFSAGPEATRILIPGLSVNVSVDTSGSRHEASKIDEETRKGAAAGLQGHEEVQGKEGAEVLTGAGR